MTKILIIMAAILAVSACHQQAQNAAGSAAPAAVPGPPGSRNTPTPAAPVALPPTPQSSSGSGTLTPTISLANGSTTVTVNPAPTPCSAEKLSNYANLLPTSTAKDEIARTVGHHDIRYAPLNTPLDANRSGRLTAELGVDGRIKRFACG
jgi:hypothetical protein